MKMKKMIYFLFALMILSANSMNAQVAIGTDPALEPHPGAILDLSPVSGNNLGLLLPKVTLTAADVWAPVVGEEEDRIDGMMVFNESTSTQNGLDGKGAYVWVSGSWKRMGASAGVNEDDYKDDADATAAGLSWRLSGLTCFDVSVGSTLPATSDYTVITSGGADIAAINWLISETKAVQSVAATEGNPAATLHFSDRAAVSALAPAEITVTALITLTKGGTTYKVSATISVKFQNQPCCEGAIIVDGAYADVAANPSLGGSFEAGWKGTFTEPIGNLCWNKSDVVNSTDWTYSNNACTGVWRLPNLMELQVLYEATGGTGSSVTPLNFSHLREPNSNPGNADVIGTRIWSCTVGDFVMGTLAHYVLWPMTGRREMERGSGEQTARCVRTL